MGTSLIDTWTKAKTYLSVVRLSSFDVSTDEGRSRERYRRVALTGITGGAAKGVALFTSLIAVPLTLNYLGPERYGLWMTISAAVALLGFADLGMGNSLLNAVAKANGNDDQELARTSVSSGFFILSAVAALIIIVIGLFYRFIPWPSVFNTSSEYASREAGPTFIVFAICFALNIPLGVVQRVQMGYQEGFANNIWQIAGSLLGLGGLLIAVQLRAGLPWLVLAIMGAPLMATLLNWFVQFGVVRPWLFPKWQYFEWYTARKIVETGTVFFWLQLMIIITVAGDNLIIARSLGSSAVAGYAVVQKLFSVTTIFAVFIIPLWPAFGEALTRNDFSWAKRTLDRALLISLGFSGFVVLILLVFGQTIVEVWIGPIVVPSVALLAGFALWTMLSSYIGVMSTFLNSSYFVRRQASIYSVAAISALVMKFVLVDLWQSAGVIWASVMGFGLFYVVPIWLLARRILHVKVN